MKKLAVILIMAVASVSYAYAQPLLQGASNQQAVMTNLSAMPLAFTENQGQWNQKVLFRAETGGATFFFCSDEVAYLFVRDSDELLEDDYFPRRELSSMPDEFSLPQHKKEALLIEAKFVDANLQPVLITGNCLPYNCNYFYGNDPSKWYTDVPNYSAIIYKDIWPGIDLHYHGNGRGMKYDFIVNPGADPSQIKIRYEGVDGLSISNSGDLQMKTSFGLIHENIPEIYQEWNNLKEHVSGCYRLIEAHVIGFKAGIYNPSRRLIIDPELIYSSYLGGGSDDYGLSVYVDNNRDIYVAGGTHSSDFPTSNGYDENYNGLSDAFVTKISNSGGSIIFSTYMGSSNQDEATAIAADGSGNCYLTGSTWSSDFPTTNPFDGTYNGNRDAIFVKLSSAGNSLQYSTYLGGSGDDAGEAIVIDLESNAYVIGETWSSDIPTVNGYDASYNGNGDCFVAKFAPSAGGVESLNYCTFLGGSGRDGDFGNGGITLDRRNNVLITSYTTSADFPLVSPYDSSPNGGRDVFIAKLSPSIGGTGSLYYSTYFGGQNNDEGNCISLDENENIYISGWTASSDFPIANAYDNSHNGNYDAFLSKFSASGRTLQYSTFLGGSLDDYGVGLAVQSSGNIYLTGWTLSTDFPVIHPYDAISNGLRDIFASKFTSLISGSNSLLYSTYLGGLNNDSGEGACFDCDGNALIVGSSFSSDFPVENAYDPTHNGGSDIVVAKFGPGESQSFQFPVDNYTPVCKDWKAPNKEGGLHIGQDVVCRGENTPVYAAGDGVVKWSGPHGEVCQGNWGTVIVIEHTLLDGSKVCSIYGHVNVMVNPGQMVARGEQIATIGDFACTPPEIWTNHLHFGIYMDEFGPYPVEYPIWLHGYLSPSNFPGKYRNPSDFIQAIDNNSLDFFVACPADMLLITPSGDSVSIDHNETDYAVYVEWDDVDSDNEYDQVSIIEPDSGAYRILVEPDANADPYSTFSLYAVGKSFAVALAEEQLIVDAPDTGFVFFHQNNSFYLAGDANMSNETVDIGNPLSGPWRVGGDVTFLVNYFVVGSGNHPCLIYNPVAPDEGQISAGYFFASGDATGDCQVLGGDVSRLVQYFGGNPEAIIRWCGWDKANPRNYYPPAWLNNRGSGLEQPVPALEELPEGWPNCQFPAVIGKR